MNALSISAGTACTNKRTDSDDNQQSTRHNASVQASPLALAACTRKSSGERACKRQISAVQRGELQRSRHNAASSNTQVQCKRREGSSTGRAGRQGLQRRRGGLRGDAQVNRRVHCAGGLRARRLHLSRAIARMTKCAPSQKRAQPGSRVERNKPKQHRTVEQSTISTLSFMHAPCSVLRASCGARSR